MAWPRPNTRHFRNVQPGLMNKTPRWRKPGEALSRRFGAVKRRGEAARLVANLLSAQRPGSTGMSKYRNHCRYRGWPRTGTGDAGQFTQTQLLLAEGSLCGRVASRRRRRMECRTKGGQAVGKRGTGHGCRAVVTDRTRFLSRQCPPRWEPASLSPKWALHLSASSP